MATLNGVFAGQPISHAQAFNNGDVLDVPGRPHVLHVRGHTPGESAIFTPERSVLISGDALVTRNLCTGVPGEP